MVMKKFHFGNHIFLNRILQTYKSLKSIGIKKFIFDAIYFKQEPILIIKNLASRSLFEEKCNLELTLVTDEEKNDLVDFYEKSEAFIFNSKDLTRRHFEDSCQCFIAKKRKKIIGFLWWADINSPLKSCRPLSKYIRNNIGMRAQDALGIDFFILPEERGSATALEFYAKACKQLNELGYERFYGTVLPDNRAARWTYNVLGLTEEKRIIERRILLCKTLFKIEEI